MYTQLQKINKKPKVFEFYTAESLWADEYRSKQMLTYHLNPDVDLASRNKDFIQRSTKWIIAHFHLCEKSKICDFGCAVGLYTTALAKSGAQVTGIDFSKNSLEYAREVANENALAIEYVHQNYLTYETTDRCDLITMIMCDFCVLSPIQRAGLLKKFHTLLTESGRVLLDVQSLHAFTAKEKSVSYEHNQLNKFWSENDYYAFVNSFKYEDEKVSLDKYTIVEETESYEVYNWFQYYSVEMLKKEFAQAGLVIESVYKNVAGDAYDPEHEEFAIVARRE